MINFKVEIILVILLMSSSISAFANSEQYKKSIHYDYAQCKSNFCAIPAAKKWSVEKANRKSVAVAVRMGTEKQVEDYRIKQVLTEALGKKGIETSRFFYEQNDTRNTAVSYFVRGKEIGQFVLNDKVFEAIDEVAERVKAQDREIKYWRIGIGYDIGDNFVAKKPLKRFDKWIPVTRKIPTLPQSCFSEIGITEVSNKQTSSLPANSNSLFGLIRLYAINFIPVSIKCGNEVAEYPVFIEGSPDNKNWFIFNDATDSLMNTLIELMVNRKEETHEKSPESGFYREIKGSKYEEFLIIDSIFHSRFIARDNRHSNDLLILLQKLNIKASLIKEGRKNVVIFNLGVLDKDKLVLSTRDKLLRFNTLATASLEIAIKISDNELTVKYERNGRADTDYLFKIIRDTQEKLLNINLKF